MAHARAGHRIKVYRCPDCQGYHVTNQDKQGYPGRYEDRDR